MFSEEEQIAINRKIEQLRKIKEGSLTPQELTNLTTKNRISWFELNKDAVLKKYENLPDVEKAYRIIFFDEMGINPEHSKMFRIDENKIMVLSYNFCPWLLASEQLEFDVKYVCKEIVEPSIQELCKMINPKLNFSRNYDKIRPYCDFCEEYFEII